MKIITYMYDTTTPAVSTFEPARAAGPRSSDQPPFAFHATGLTGFGENRTWRQLAARLGADALHVDAVTVDLVDMNGPLLRGRDQRCVLIVHLRQPGGQVVIEDFAGEPVVAIDGAIERAVRGVQRAVSSYSPPQPTAQLIPATA